ncbi:hypothetical protein [Vibrio sonorensis]|uniref:hypothetical protein n=1 Tax=Vibrio sonorensis TaxID=1004316 RepID=UPI0008DAF853|nr:hypothetical protein [Vibrio sonorensis]
MSQKLTYSARTNEHEDHIVLVCTAESGDVSEIAHELYHTENDVEFEALPYEVGTTEFDVMMEELERLRAELYGKRKRQPFPELNKDCIQRVVQLNRSIQNKAGELFPEGTLMVVTQRHKRDKEVSIRPLNGSIRVSEDACNFLGDKDDFGFSPQQ